MTISTESSLATIPHRPTAKHLVPCPWLSAISPEVAVKAHQHVKIVTLNSESWDVLTSIPQDRTWLATFLAPGQSSGVPIALNHMLMYVVQVPCREQCTHSSPISKCSPNAESVRR